jgi:PEP-CTERM motif-containing protein
MAHPLRTPWAFVLLLSLLPVVEPVRAIDIVGVQNAALDQPRINALLRRPGSGDPLVGTDIFGDPTITIQAFFDTGASGVVLSEETANSFGVQRSINLSPPPPFVLFEDIGVAGSAQFHVSERLLINIAPSTPSADISNPATYNQSFGPLRTQIGPLGTPSNPLFGGLDVFGMPTMAGKVVVMDPKPLNALSDTMRTYVYDPGTPFSPGSADFNPGIPPTNRTIGLSYASADRFTRLTPSSAEGPAQRSNPFIGPNPLAKLDPSAPPDATPGVTLTLGDKQTTGSFLLDTGAAASVISLEQAAHLSVRYRPGVPDPVLELFDPAHPESPGTELPDQFVITLSGIGGDKTAAGFFLDSMLVRTREGNALNDNDPDHLRYLRAPVLVADISLIDPVTLQVLTLDGLFAMNLLVASIFFSEPFTFGEFNPSPFSWVVFDEPNGLLALDVTAVPEPGTWAMLVAGLALLALISRPHSGGRTHHEGHSVIGGFVYRGRALPGL